MSSVGPLEVTGVRSHGAIITSDCETAKVGTGNSGLQKEQHILLTMEPSLQPPGVRFGSTSKASVFEALGISYGRASSDCFPMRSYQL